MTANVVVEQSDVPYLDFADPRFSIRSQTVRDARAASWYARTPYGLAVLRYEDMRKLLLHPNLRQGSYQWPEHNKVTGQFADWWIRILLNQVGTDHARLRRLAMPAFSQKLIASLQPKFIAIANELIDSFAPKGCCEFMSEFSEPYATRVICDLLVLPHSEWKKIAELVTVMGLALGVTYKQDLERIEAATEGLFGYARDLIEERRRQPGDDFISVLVTTNSDKDALSDQELEDMVVLSIFGGIDTTRNQIGLAMDQFITHPDQWTLLGERPDLARSAVEEVMRTRPTTTWVTRSAMQDFTYKDLDIKAGTTLHLLAESAGTDPDAFEPGFDITAKRKQHFGFGAGMHHCLGHFIARGDMTEALKLLAQRLKNVRYGGEPKWLPDSGNTGPVELPIAFDPEG